MIWVVPCAHHASQAVVDEAVMDSSLHALIGIVCGGFSPGISGGTHDGCHQASLSKSSRMTQLSAASRLRALGKLAQLVDTCSGDDFMQITRKQGVMAVVSQDPTGHAGSW